MPRWKVDFFLFIFSDVLVETIFISFRNVLSPRDRYLNPVKLYLCFSSDHLDFRQVFSHVNKTQRAIFSLFKFRTKMLNADWSDKNIFQSDFSLLATVCRKVTSPPKGDHSNFTSFFGPGKAPLPLLHAAGSRAEL